MATPKLILDNRVNVSSEFDQLVKYSGVNVNYFEINPDGTSPYQNQVLYNNIVVPNLSTTLVSRNIRHRYDVSVTYDVTSVNKPNFAGVNDTVNPPVLQENPNAIDTVLRGPFPLQSICSSTSLTINSGTNTINSRTVLDPLSRRLSRKYLMGEASECPSMLDNRWTLVTDAGGSFLGVANITLDNAVNANWAAFVAKGAQTFVIAGQNLVWTPVGANPPAVGADLSTQFAAINGYKIQAICTVALGAGPYIASAIVGQVRLYQSEAGSNVSSQPLSAYENCAHGESRASFLPYSATRAGNNVTVKFNVTEQLYISPCTLFSNETFLANVNTLSLLYNYGQLTDIFVSANPAVTISSIQIADAHLSLAYIQINPEVMSIPRQVSYGFENIVYFTKLLSNGSMAGSAIPAYNTFQSDTVRLQAMPLMIYVALRNDINSRTPATPACFYQLGQLSGSAPAGVSINIGNRTGLGSSASPATWYRMAKKNGYSGSFNEWQTSGCVLMINPVEDLGVDPSLDSLPLQTGSVNFQIQANFNNSNLVYAGATTPAQAELIIVVVYGGVATITTDQCMFNLGALSANEVNATLASAGKEGQTFSSEHVTPTILGQGLASSGKVVLGKMASKHQRSKLSM